MTIHKSNISLMLQNDTFNSPQSHHSVYRSVADLGFSSKELKDGEHKKVNVCKILFYTFFFLIQN